MAEEEVDFAVARKALQPRPLACDSAVPAAISPRGPDWKRAAVGEAAQAAETEACSRTQVVQAVTERHRPACGITGASAGERLGVVVVSVHEQKLEAGPAEYGARRAEEAAPFWLAR